MNFRTYDHYLNRITKLMSKGDVNKRLVNKAKRRLNRMGEVSELEVKMYNSARRLKYGNIIVQPARIIINKYNLIF